MIARFFYRLFLRLFAKRIIKDAYHGVLSRPADENGLSAYCQELSQRRDLAWLISDLLASAEARNRYGLTAPNEIVTQAFEAVLHRAPTREELDVHVARLSEGQSIAALLVDLSAGHAGVGKISHDEAEGLVRAAFRALLHREPEPTALAAYAHLLIETGDITAFLDEVGHSQEHIETLGYKPIEKTDLASLRRPRALAMRR